MEKIVLKPLYHDSQDCIGIYFPGNKLLNQCIKKVGGVRWNPNEKCWWLPCTEMNYEKIAQAFLGRAMLQTHSLKEFLLKEIMAS